MNNKELLDEPPSNRGEDSAGSVDYYKLRINNPVTFQPYDAECLDIIENLEMSFDEGELFKAIWRKCAARKGKLKKGNTAKRDAEKALFYAQRIVACTGEDNG